MNADLQNTINQRKSYMIEKARPKHYAKVIVKDLESQAGAEAQKEILDQLKKIRESLAESLSHLNVSTESKPTPASSVDNLELYNQLVAFR